MTDYGNRFVSRSDVTTGVVFKKDEDLIGFFIRMKLIGMMIDVYS